MVIVLVIIALLLGFISAYVIAMMSAGSYSRNVLNEMNASHAPVPRDSHRRKTV